MNRAEGSVAIVGMAGRFPGAGGLDRFWSNLIRGEVSIRRFTEPELARSGVPAAVYRSPDYRPFKGALDEDVGLFDCRHFGIPPREAALIDPQQRALLECSRDAFEDAACDPGAFPGSIGVFAGAGKNTYLLFNLAASQELALSADLHSILAGNEKDYLAGRLSYAFGLKGPSVSVQTACSTGLVALHLAVQSLQAHECDLALVGAVAIDVPQFAGYVYREEAMLSSDGACRPFDQEASGTVFGNGVAAVVLRRTEDALAARDPIRALILGTAVNNDGSRKVAFGVPSVEGQADVAREALAVAGVDPAAVGLLETHGTGTRLGDRIEIDALRAAYGDGPAESCQLGTLKANIGHLGAAAGLAGLVKAVLSLEAGRIPPAANFTRPAASLSLSRSRFFLRTAAGPWPLAGPRLAAVHAAAVGGSNAHVILEEAPALVSPAGRAGRRSSYLFLLSAGTASGLDRYAEKLAEALEAAPSSPEDVEWTLAVGRSPQPLRRAIVAESGDQLRRQLRTGGSAQSRRSASQLELAFGPAFGGELAADFATLPVLEERHGQLLGRLGLAAAEPAPVRELLAQLSVALLVRDLIGREIPARGFGTGELAARCFRGELELERLPVEIRRFTGGQLDSKEKIHPPRLRLDLAAADGDFSLRRSGGLLAVLGEIWCAGIDLDWRVLQRPPARSLRLPTRPFERVRCWVEPPPFEPRLDQGQPSSGPALLSFLKTLFEEHLGAGPIADDDDLLDLGAGSMDVLRLTAAIEATLGIKLPGNSIYRFPTVRALARAIEEKSERRPPADPGPLAAEDGHAADWRLEPDIRPPGKPARAVRTVLLTGATGFLGAHILNQLLLARPDLTIYCPVRADSVAAGRERICSRFRDLRLDPARIDARVLPLVADLGRPRLGLTEAEFGALAQTVDTIVHCAAQVSFVSDYVQVKRVNVDAVREVLRLASQGCAKSIHHLSSIAVFEAQSLRGVERVPEDLPLERCRGFSTGYALSKWIAERMIGEARKRGFVAAIYRPSNIVGDSLTGIVLPDHIGARFLKGCLEVGSAPTDVTVNLVCADDVARTVAGSALEPLAEDRDLHLVNAESTPVSLLLQWLRELGYVLEPVPYQEWAPQILAAQAATAFFPFRSLIERGTIFTHRTYLTGTSRGFLRQIRPIDRNLLSKHLDSLARKGQL